MWLKDRLFHQLLSRAQAELHTLISRGDSPESMDASAASVVVSSASWHVGMPNLQTTCCWIMDGALGSKIHTVHWESEIHSQRIFQKWQIRIHTQMEPHTSPAMCNISFSWYYTATFWNCSNVWNAKAVYHLNNIEAIIIYMRIVTDWGCMELLVVVCCRNAADFLCTHNILHTMGVPDIFN